MRVLRPCPHIFGFQDGRTDRPCLHDTESWYEDGALALGICSYAVVDGDAAIVYDTHALIDHARFVRGMLEAERIRRMTVVLSHWHADHVAGNAVFDDCEIVAIVLTRDALAAHRNDLESELPPMRPLIMPTRPFEDSLCQKVARIAIELRHLDIHSSDGTVVILPTDHIALAGDTVEDPITYVVERERFPENLRDLLRLQDWPTDRVFSNHRPPDLIAAGGYDPRIIAATIEYIETLLMPSLAKSIDKSPLKLLSGAFEAKSIFYHPPTNAYIDETCKRSDHPQGDQPIVRISGIRATSLQSHGSLAAALSQIEDDQSGQAATCRRACL